MRLVEIAAQIGKGGVELEQVVCIREDGALL